MELVNNKLKFIEQKLLFFNFLILIYKNQKYYAIIKLGGSYEEVC